LIPMIRRIRQRRLLIDFIVFMTLGWAVISLSARPGWAASAKSRYFVAERCYRQLQKNTQHQKYRERWLRCINGFLSVYKQEPSGVWAAASLYQAATLYTEMYKRSFFEGDKQEALDLYNRVISRFSKSHYRPKAVAARNRLMQGQPANAGEATDAPVVAKATNTPDVSANGPDTDISLDNATTDTPAMVEGLRFWSNPRYTRVVIDVSQDTIFTYHELRKDTALGKPQRIYIDMHGSRLAQNLQKVVSINDNLLKDARAGQYSQDTVRVVVDIKSSKTFKIFSLKNPFRVVLDVWGLESETAGSGQGGKMPPMVVKNGKKIQPSAIAKQLALGVRRIVIDPGHGGKDYGAPGYLKGVHEKTITLQIAHRLEKMIHKQLKCETILTRDKDKYISLEERTAIANTQNADLFVSIHTNASPDKRAFGVETYILNLATDDEAIRVAAMENATSAKNISDLDSILQDLMQNAKVNESTRLASDVQDAMDHKLRIKYDHIRNKGIKQAPFYVLLGADMPSILVETSFISNPRECRRLESASYQWSICQGIVDGIKRYMKETNPLAFKQETMGKGG
jgi:N-acetylmuramoyl-L-alanine amidase